MFSEVKTGAGFSALSNAHRLKLFRLLVRQGPAASLPATSLHLTQLECANLVRPCRIGRRIL
jgi:hypothetical protein